MLTAFPSPNRLQSDSLIYDAHNHLQDPRLADRLDGILTMCRREGVARAVVNGTREQDWPHVLELARRHSVILPSFGVHPWHVAERTAKWKDTLLDHLNSIPSAIGEIGLDRWMKNPNTGLQEEMFCWQLGVAAERNLPVTIHCLNAWGRLDQILRKEQLPGKGFLLHSYGGPAEMVDGFVKLGGYFSLSGYFAHDRKSKQRESFRRVPLDRLLIETDAPDMLPPEGLIRYPLDDFETHKPLNHPANLRSVYEFAARLFELPVNQLAGQVEKNFNRFFDLPRA